MSELWTESSARLESSTANCSRQEAVPYGVPRRIELGYQDGKPVEVTITLLDANHCPGSTMLAEIRWVSRKADLQVPDHVVEACCTAYW